VFIIIKNTRSIVTILLMMIHYKEKSLQSGMKV